MYTSILLYKKSTCCLVYLVTLLWILRNSKTATSIKADAWELCNMNTMILVFCYSLHSQGGGLWHCLGYRSGQGPVALPITGCLGLAL